jgi:hypothetical protein
VLAKNSLESETEALGGATRRRVERVALPFVPSIAKLIEDVSRKQILRLGRTGCPLHRRRVQDVANLDDAIGRIDAQEGLIAHGLSRCVVNDGKEQRIGRARLGLETGAKFIEALVGAVEQVGPHRFAGRVAVRAIKERLGVRVRVEGDERDPPPFQRDPLRPLGRMRVDGRAYGQGGGHAFSLLCVSSSDVATKKPSGLSGP